MLWPPWWALCTGMYTPRRMPAHIATSRARSAHVAMLFVVMYLLRDHRSSFYELGHFCLWSSGATFEPAVALHTSWVRSGSACNPVRSDVIAGGGNFE